MLQVSAVEIGFFFWPYDVALVRDALAAAGVLVGASAAVATAAPTN